MTEGVRSFECQFREEGVAGGYSSSSKPASFTISSSFTGEQGGAAVTHVGQTSTFFTCMNLTTAMIGAGVLGFPKIFSLAGWYVAPVMLIFSGWAMAESGIALSQSLDFLDSNDRSSSSRCPTTYEDLAELALGHTGKVCVRVVFILFMLCFGSVLVILIGGGLETISNAWLPYRVWVLIVYLPFAAIVAIGNMKFFSRLSLVGVLASVVYVLAICTAGFLAGGEVKIKSLKTRSDPDGADKDQFTYSTAPESLLGLGQVLAVMLFGYGYQYMLPTMRAEMSRPQELRWAIIGAICLGGAFYLAVGVIGYYGWGDHVAGQVVDTMADPCKCHCSGAPISAVGLSAAVVANILVTFPIVMQCLAQTVEVTLGKEPSVVQRVVLVSGAVVIGLLCPYFLDVVGVVSSLFGACIFLLFPIAFNFGVQPPIMGSLAMAKRTVVFVTGFAALVFGTYQSFNGLYSSMSKGDGNPFTNFLSPLNPPRNMLSHSCPFFST